MARKLQLKRGQKADMPILAEGEPGFALDERRLYVGTGTENVPVAMQSDVQKTEEKCIGLEEEVRKNFWMAEKSRAVLQEQIMKNQRALRALSQEEGVITLTNSKRYPFNNSLKTIALAAVREKKEYQVYAEVLSVSGGFVGDVEVTDKQTNGFKLSYTGSAASVQLRYVVEGGYYE